MIPDTLARLKAVRQRTFELIEDYSQEAFDKSPEKGCSFFLGEAGTWTAGEVIDHIVRVMTSLSGEIARLIELEESGQKPELSRSIKDYDVSVGFLPKGMMPLAEPLITVGNQFASAVLSRESRQSFMRTRHFHPESIAVDADAAAVGRGSSL